jgi:hypothetical protein
LKSSFTFLLTFVCSSHRYLEQGSSSVSIVTTLRTGRPGFDFRQGQLPRPDRILGPHSFLSSVYRCPFSRGQSCRVMKLTTHFNLEPRLRMRGGIPHSPISLHIVMLKSRATLLCGDLLPRINSRKREHPFCFAKYR